MHLVQVTLQDFRCYRQLELTLPAGLIVAQGPNAAGKSAFLEALTMLATGKSPRAGATREVVRLQAEETLGFAPLARIAAQVQRQDHSVFSLDLIVQLAGGSQRGGWTRMRVNRRPLSIQQARGHLRAVLFAPEDLELIAGSPARRRGYLDTVLLQDNPAYAHALGRYQQVLVQRNELLRRRQPAGQRVEPGEFAFWNQELVEYGATLIEQRQRLLDELALVFAGQHEEISGESLPATLRYHATVSSAGASCDELRARLQDALATAWPHELRRGMTLVGPHLDELRFFLDQRDLAHYGSRGQQRTAIIALKLAEIAWQEARCGEAPLVLFDDVLSELDPTRQRCLQSWLLQTAHQVVLTTTHLGLLQPIVGERAQVYQVAAGQWTPLQEH